MGAADAIRDAAGFAVTDERDLARRAAYDADLGARLGPEAYERALAAGRALSPDAAVAYALSEDDSANNATLRE